MSPDAEFTQTLSFLPGVADSITWMNWWGGWCLLAMAAVMALAAARELWPLLGLQLATRNRLTPGRCLVDGIIEPGGEQSPVVVQVDQEHKRGLRFRRWVERSRRVEIAPFHIRLDDGRRVHVVPADQLVTLLCKLRRPASAIYGDRTLTAKVSVGDRVLVDGMLAAPSVAAGPYRGDDEGRSELQLQPLAGLPLWIAVEREARSMMLRASAFYATLMLVLLATVLVAQRSAGLRELREFAAHGQVVDAKILEVYVPQKGAVIVRAVLPSGRQVTSPIARDASAALQPGSTMPWTYLPADPSINSPGVFQRSQPLAMVLVIGGWVTCLLALWIYWRSFRPWYRRYNVNQTDF